MYVVFVEQLRQVGWPTPRLSTLNPALLNPAKYEYIV